MAGKRYNVVFSGKLVEDRPPEEVLAKLCSVLELEQQQVREIFKGGFGAIVLKDQDSSKAYNMREDLRDAGAICTVHEITESSAGDMRAMEAPRQTRSTQRPPQDSRPLRPPPAVVAKSGPGIGGLIFRVILVIALAGGGWWGYQTYLARP